MPECAIELLGPWRAVRCVDFIQFERLAAKYTKKKIRKSTSCEPRSVHLKTRGCSVIDRCCMKRASVRETPRVIQWLWEKYSETMADNRQLAPARKSLYNKYPHRRHRGTFGFPGVILEVPRISNMHEKVGGSRKKISRICKSAKSQGDVCRELNNQGVLHDEIIRSHQGLGHLPVVISCQTFFAECR